MALIPQPFIDELLARTDIVSVIEARVALKKAGHEFQARCPFHDEKTPSFTVSPTKQFYHCFGCGAHGTAISFLMDYDRLEFRDAVELLAGQAGMQIPDDDQAGPRADTQKPLFAALEAAENHFRACLRESQTAIDYLKGRGISGALARTYGLGFAPPGWDHLLQRLPDRKAAIAAGLVIAHDDTGKTYDRFRNRVMFPIRDGRGRTIAFGGRTLGDDKAKYLNSPETPLFHKGRQLYGLYEARQQLKTIPRMLVVEGYMDVLALAQHGFVNAVATLGTATTSEHLQLLFRVSEEVIFCFDGDAAGERAGWRALEQSLPVMRGTRRVRFLYLPAGEDPDSLVRGTDGARRFQALIDASLPASQVLLDGLARGVDMTIPDGRSQLAEKARPYIEKLPPEAFKAQMIQQLAQRCGLPAEDLQRLYARDTAAPPAGPQHQPAQPGRSGVRITPVRRALQLLMNNPRLADNIAETTALRSVSTAGAQLLAEAIEFYRGNPTFTLAMLLERWREREAADAVQRLAMQRLPGDPALFEREFVDCIHKITGDTVDERTQRYRELSAKFSDGTITPDEQHELQALHKAGNTG